MYLIEEILGNISNKEEDKKIIIRDQKTIFYVKISDVERCEADGPYTTLYLSTNEKIVTTRPLKEYAEMLPE